MKNLKAVGGISTPAKVAGWLKLVDKSITKGLLIRGSRAMAVTAAIALLLLLLMTVTDVVYRNTGNMPPWKGGGFELTELFMPIVSGMGFLWCWYKGGHVRVDFVLDRLPLRFRYGYTAFISLCGAIFLGGATWAMIIITSNSFRTDSASQMLRMPVWPFQLIFVIGMGLFTLAMLRSVVSYVQGALGRSFDWWTVDVRDSKREETR